MQVDDKKTAAIVERVENFMESQTGPRYCNPAEYDDVLAQLAELIEVKRRASRSSD